MSGEERQRELREQGPAPAEAEKAQGARDSREAATAEEAAEAQAAAGARTPVPGEQADAKLGRRARRARRRRQQAESDPAPGAAGGAGSKRREAEANAERPGGEGPERPVEDDEIDGAEARVEQGRAEDAEEDASGDAEEARPRRAARRRAAETTTGSGRRPARRRTPEEPVSVRAQAKYVRCAPRKARLVIEHIRGKSVDDARAILLTTPRAASRDVLKLLDSCVANAENNHELSADELRVAKAYVDEGPTLKRYRPRALGRATRIRKRTSHMTIYLTNQEGR